MQEEVLWKVSPCPAPEARPSQVPWWSNKAESGNQSLNCCSYLIDQNSGKQITFLMTPSTVSNLFNHIHNSWRQLHARSFLLLYQKIKNPIKFLTFFFSIDVTCAANCLWTRVTSRLTSWLCIIKKGTFIVNIAIKSLQLNRL